MPLPNRVAPIPDQICYPSSLAAPDYIMGQFSARGLMLAAITGANAPVIRQLPEDQYRTPILAAPRAVSIILSAQSPKWGSGYCPDRTGDHDVRGECSASSRETCPERSRGRAPKAKIRVQGKGRDNPCPRHTGETIPSRIQKTAPATIVTPPEAAAT